MLASPRPPLMTRRTALHTAVTALAAGVLAGCGTRGAVQPAVALPIDPAADLAPDLVDLARFDPRFRFDIRYATPANFMGRVLYPVARAVAQGLFRHPGVSPPETVGREPGCYDFVMAQLAERGIVFKQGRAVL